MSLSSYDLPNNYQFDNTSFSINLCVDHRVNSEDAVEYFDGVFVAYCSICDSRIEIDRIPFGSSVARAKALKKIVDSGEAQDVHRMELGLLKSFMRKDLDAVKEAASILAEIEEYFNDRD